MSNLSIEISEKIDLLAQRDLIDLLSQWPWTREEVIKLYGEEKLNDFSFDQIETLRLLDDLVARKLVVLQRSDFSSSGCTTEYGLAMPADWAKSFLS